MWVNVSLLILKSSFYLLLQDRKLLLNRDNRVLTEFSFSLCRGISFSLFVRCNKQFIMKNFFNYFIGNLKNDVLSGLTVALALVLEAVAFAFVAGIDPLVVHYSII